MKLAFLGPLYARQGPFACVYMDTSRDVENPDPAIVLRWRRLEHLLQAQGADMATTGALGRAVGEDRNVSGRHGQAIFAAHGRLALVEELAEPPVRESARFTMVPDATALALQHAPDISYAAAVVRRVATADGLGPQDMEVDLQSGRWPAARVGVAAASHRRVPAGEWRQAVASVARDLAELADKGDAETLVLCGDHWARGVLAHALPQRLRDRVVFVDDGFAVEAGRALLEQELDYLFRGRLSARDQETVERFLACRASGRGTTEGLAAVLEALRAGQAQALLINDPPALPERLWIGMTAKQIASSAAELHSIGVESPWEEHADAALIRAVAGTVAELIVVPRENLPLDEGLGVLLRDRDGCQALSAEEVSGRRRGRRLEPGG